MEKGETQLQNKTKEKQIRMEQKSERELQMGKE